MGSDWSFQGIRERGKACHLLFSIGLGMEIPEVRSDKAHIDDRLFSETLRDRYQC